MRGLLWLERAKGDDAPHLAALEAECFSHPWTEEQLRQEIAYGPPGAVLLLRSAAGGPSSVGGRTVAAFCAYRVLVDEAHVMDVAVARRWRRRGLGSWLVRFCLARAGREGALRALLEVRAGNAPARRLYERLGFSEISRRRDYYTGPVEDAVVLSLELPAASS